MKTLSIIILFVFSSHLLTGQKTEIPRMEIRNLDGNSFISTEILDPESSTLVVLWGHIKDSDQEDIERIQSAWLKNLKPQGVKMVVVCAGNIMSKNQLKALAKKRNWEFEIYLDYYGEFIRGTNVTCVPGILFSGKSHIQICHNHINCAGKINLICENILENLKNSAQHTQRTYDSTKKQNHMPPSLNSRL